MARGTSWSIEEITLLGSLAGHKWDEVKAKFPERSALSIKGRSRQMGITFARETPYRYTRTHLTALVKASTSWTDLSRQLNINVGSSNLVTVRRYVEEYGLDTSHFSSKSKPTRSADDLFTEGSSACRSSVKKKIYKDGLLPRVCCMCGQGEEWQGKPMSLVLDHINGVPNDHRLENLRLVCPNCNATLPTFAGKKNRNRKIRVCLHIGCGKAHENPMFCSVKCFRASGVGEGPRPKQRRVERPSLDQLIQEIQDTNMVQVGKKYGVSDNAVRKWLANYGFSGKVPRKKSPGSGSIPSGATGDSRT